MTKPSRGENDPGLFEVIAEEHLTQPTIIYEFPTAISPLSKQKPMSLTGPSASKCLPEDGNCERLQRIERSEDQRRRFEGQLKERERATTRPIRWTKITYGAVVWHAARVEWAWD